MAPVSIAPLIDAPNIRAMLRRILIETVASGGSVSFMHPLAPEAAELILGKVPCGRRAR